MLEEKKKEIQRIFEEAFQQAMKNVKENDDEERVTSITIYNKKIWRGKMDEMCTTYSLRPYIKHSNGSSTFDIIAPNGRCIGKLELYE